MPKPERYVVHIYRREESGSAIRVVGLLEKIGNGSQYAFSSKAQLWTLLNGDKRQASGARRRRRKPGRKAAR